MMINKQKLVNPENLPVIEWQGVRVVTTETLAAGYGTTPIRIQQNYIRNEDRFVEGKHFFKISGDELKSFRLSFSESVNKHTTSLVLWTERGAARMSKIVDTDEAWLFFEKWSRRIFVKQRLLQTLFQTLTIRSLLLKRGLKPKIRTPCSRVCRASGSLHQQTRKPSRRWHHSCAVLQTAQRCKHSSD